MGPEALQSPPHFGSGAADAEREEMHEEKKNKQEHQEFCLRPGKPAHEPSFVGKLGGDKEFGMGELVREVMHTHLCLC